MVEKKPVKKPTRDQAKAVRSLEGLLFVAAGAGSGKTGVVSRRFVHAVATGAAGVDEILTITFTRKAAAEMMDRIRDYMRHPEKTGIEYGEEEQARLEAACREIERARISTIDSFCSGVLRMSALAAGIDPEFATADETQEAVLKQKAFENALGQLLDEHGDDAANLMAAYDDGLSGKLFATVNGLYNRFRSWGLEPELPVPSPPDLNEARRCLKEAVEAMQAAIKREKAGGKLVEAFLEDVPNIMAALEESEVTDCLHLLNQGKWTLNIAKSVRDDAKAVKAQKEFFITSHVAAEAARTKTVPMFARLLKLFATSYAAVKKERGVLDFSDLAIMTRDLLRGNEGVRRRVSSNYKLIMVDEFQDTSRVQYEIMELLARGNLMLVGDRNQSIYGFRDAEVELFQKEDEKAEKEDYRVTLKANFRSQPEVLAFIDHIFWRGGMLESRGYLELEAAADPADDGEHCRVELLLVDKAGREGDPENRNKAVTQPAEAELIARRLRELIKAGRYRPEDIALLFRTGSDVTDYRDALERADIRTYFTLGAGYHARLELGDAVCMLRLLVNPLDDMSLLAVLRSPFAGVADDTLYRLRQASKTAGGRNKSLWPAVKRAAELEEISAADRRRLTAFVEGFTGLRRLAAREPLAAIVRRVLDFNDYAAAMAAGTDGKQSLANLLKLVDLAAEFEETWGRDLAMLTEFLSNQKEASGGENEAPMEKEGVDAVRVMTIHKAKGLEFPLVVLPRLHSKPGGGWANNKPVFLVDREQKQLGLSYKDTNGLEDKIFDYTELEKENDERELEEEKRLGYVAMTRARKHLILAGAAEVDKSPEEAIDKKQPLEWVRHFLDVAGAVSGEGAAAKALDESGCQEFTLDVVAGSPVSVRVCRDPFALLATAGPAGAGEGQDEVAPVSADIAMPLPPPRFVPHSISPTALDTFRACPRCYYLENVLDAGGIVEDEKSTGEAAAGTAAGGLSASQMGTLVHAILERADLPAAGPPSDTELNEQAARVLEAGVELSAGDRERAAKLVYNLTRAPVAPLLAGAAAAGELRREQDFAILVGETIVHGKIDALARVDGAALVVDYKTGNLSEDYSYEVAVKKYENQMAAYALAASRIYPGLPVRVVLVFLNHPELEHPREYQPEEIVKLEDSLAATIASMADGDFAPLPKLDKHQCYSCPGGPADARLCPLAK